MQAVHVQEVESTWPRITVTASSLLYKTELFLATSVVMQNMKNMTKMITKQ